MLTINYNQVLNEVKKKKAEIIKLKGRRRFSDMLDDDIVVKKTSETLT